MKLNYILNDFFLFFLCKFIQPYQLHGIEKYKKKLLCNSDEEIYNHLSTKSKLNKYSALIINKDTTTGQRCKCTATGNLKVENWCRKQKQRSKSSKGSETFEKFTAPLTKYCSSNLRSTQEISFLGMVE